MSRSRARILLLVIVLVLVALDQIAKELAREHLQTTRVLAAGTVILHTTENRGAFLSLGSNLPPHVRTLLFVGLVALVVVFSAIFCWRNPVPLFRSTPVSLVVAGGVGNLIDRVFREGSVTDFIYLQIGPLHTGVFNVADVAITTAAVWILLEPLLKRKSAQA